jgi:hypothetical protein
MFYRLAALPPAWVEAPLFILEDRVGRLFLLDPTTGRLDPLDPTDANMLMQWYELSQVASWYSLPRITQILSTTGPRRSRRVDQRILEEVGSPVAIMPSVATGIFDLADDQQPDFEI